VLRAAVATACLNVYNCQGSRLMRIAAGLPPRHAPTRPAF